MKYVLYIFSISLIMSLGSCNSDVTKSFESKPYALARMNEILVIADEELWESPVQDTFNFYFQSAYPIMPSPEPMFDVRHFTTRELEGEELRKELRTYIVLADLSDPESSTTQMVRRDLGEERFLKAKQDPTFRTSVGKDKWARDQILIYIFGDGKKKLYETIRENYPAIAKRIRLHDSPKLDASIYVVRNENPGFMSKMRDKFGFALRIPSDFDNILPDEENMMYFKKDKKGALMNIVIRKFPYTSENQLSTDSIIKMRDDYGAKYVTSEAEGSYMVTNTEDLPTYTYTYTIDDQYTKEVRGIWELENDYKGGPYATYIILNKATNELIFIDTFVLAPGMSKRDMMMQLDYIVKTSKFVEVAE